VSQPHSLQVRPLRHCGAIPSALITVATPSNPTGHTSRRSDCQLPGPFTPTACERTCSTGSASLARAWALLLRIQAIAACAIVQRTIPENAGFVKLRSVRFELMQIRNWGAAQRIEGVDTIEKRPECKEVAQALALDRSCGSCQERAKGLGCAAKAPGGWALCSAGEGGILSLSSSPGRMHGDDPGRPGQRPTALTSATLASLFTLAVRSFQSMML
jgi:hypothetical protein